MNRIRYHPAPFLAFLTLLLLATATAAEPRHGIAMHGEPGYSEGFRHFRYVNPDAPKGGELKLAVVGSFDSTNPLTLLGQPAEGVREYVFESLMARAMDEPFSLYGLIAETIETADDRSWVEFRLRPQARFSDGHPLTADDVVFSLETLRDHGRPNHQYYYSKVVRVERPGPRTVRFVLDGGDREMPLILGLMPVIPKHHYEGRKFEATTLDAPLGSGPYIVDRIEPGRAIRYRRNPDYWGRDLAVIRGRFNFDVVRYDYYRDANAAFEAFKKGLYDFRSEGDPTRWSRGYNFAAVADGEVIREEFETGVPAPMSAFVFNTRRPLFVDARVRQALLHLFDFEWANKNLFHGLYERTQSFFHGSELSSHGRPADPRERTLLAPFAGAVPEDIMEGRYALPMSDGSGRDRSQRRRALDLMAEAGYLIRNGVAIDPDGRPVRFEIMVASREQERVALHFSRSLKAAGIGTSIRLVDSAQFQRRLQTYDFDMVPFTWYNSLSPGNEQAFYWGSQGRNTEGTRNYMGVAEPAIDAMIEAMLQADARPDFISAVRALDRLLMAGRYVIPLYHAPRQWTAYRSHLAHPETTSLYGYQLDTWWRVENR